MNIEEERDEIIEHANNLARMALVYRGRNMQYISQITGLEIRALSAELKLAKLGWVSVKDEMPKNNTEVLVTIESAWGPKVKTAELNNYNCGDQWKTTDGIYYHGTEFSRVTHWMPKPEPAAEELNA